MSTNIVYFMELVLISLKLLKKTDSNFVPFQTLQLASSGIGNLLSQPLWDDELVGLLRFFRRTAGFPRAHVVDVCTIAVLQALIHGVHFLFVLSRAVRRIDVFGQQKSTVSAFRNDRAAVVGLQASVLGERVFLASLRAQPVLAHELREDVRGIQGQV